MPNRVTAEKAKEIHKKLTKRQQRLPFRGAIRLSSYEKRVTGDLDDFEKQVKGPWLFNTEANPYTQFLKDLDPAYHAWACPPGIRTGDETVYHLARSCQPLLQDITLRELIERNPELDEDNENYPQSPVDEFLQCLLDPEREKALERSIETFGLLQPPLITMDGDVILGKRRLKTLIRIISKYNYNPLDLKITCYVYPIRGKFLYIYDKEGDKLKKLEAYIDHIRGSEALTHRGVEGDARKELRKRASLDRYLEKVAEERKLFAETKSIIKRLSETLNRLKHHDIEEDLWFSGAMEEIRKIIAEVAEFDNELVEMLKNKDQRELARKKLAFYRKMAEMLESYGFAFIKAGDAWENIKSQILAGRKAQKELEKYNVIEIEYNSLKKRHSELHKEYDFLKEHMEDVQRTADHFAQKSADLEEELEEAKKELERLKAGGASKEEIEKAETNVEELENDLITAQGMLQEAQKELQKAKEREKKLLQEKAHQQEEIETLSREIERLNFVLKQKEEELEKNREELTEQYKHRLAQELEERVEEIRAEYSERIREKEEEILAKYREKQAKLDEKIREFEQKSQVVEEEFLKNKEKLVQALEKAQSQGALLDVFPKKDKTTINNIVNLNLTLETLFGEVHRLVQVLQGSTKRLEKELTPQMKAILRSYIHSTRVNINIIGKTLLEADQWLTRMEAILGIKGDPDGNGGPGGGKKTEKSEELTGGEAVQQDSLVTEPAEGVAAIANTAETNQLDDKPRYRDRGAELLKQPKWQKAVDAIVKSYEKSSPSEGMDNDGNYAVTKLFLKKRVNIEKKFAQLGYKVPKLKKGETVTEHFRKFLEDMKAKKHPYYQEYKELVDEYNRLKAETWGAWYNFAEQAARQICSKYGGGLTFDEIDPSGELEQKISGALEQALDRMKTVNPNYIKSWVMQKIQSALQIKSAPTILILGDEEFIGNCKTHLQLDKYFIHTASDAELAELKLQGKIDCVITNLPIESIKKILSNPKLKNKKLSFMFINSEEDIGKVSRIAQEIPVVDKITFEEIPFGLETEIDFYEIMDSFLNSSAKVYNKKVRKWNPLLSKSFDQIIDEQGEMQSQMKSMKFLYDSFPFYLAHENGIIPQVERRGPPHNIVQQAKV